MQHLILSVETFIHSFFLFFFFQHVTKVEAYLPRGLWYDWYAGSVVETEEEEEGSYITLPAPYDTIPLLVLGGNVLATHVPGNTTEQRRVFNTFHVFQSLQLFMFVSTY